MPKVTLHPGVLAMPDSPADRKSFEEYLRKLLGWSSILNANWIALCISCRSLQILADSEFYPSRQRLAASFQGLGISEYSTNDIASVVSFILTKSLQLEFETGIEDVSWTKLQCTPPIDIPGGNASFPGELERLLIILSIHRNYFDQYRSNHILAVPNKPSNGSEMTVEAVVDLIEFSSETADVRTPLSLNASVLICDDEHSLIFALDECELLSTAPDQQGVERSIKVAWAKESARGGVRAPITDAPQFKIGNEFLSSAQSCRVLVNRAKTEKLMSTILDVLFKRNLQKSHALRKSKSGASSTVRRGADKAVRWDIDYEHHLHVWDMPNGIPEFASVVPHHMMTIPF